MQQGHDAFPVHQQIKQRDRNQHRITHHRERHTPPHFERSEQRGRCIFHIGTQVFQHKRFQIRPVERPVQPPLCQPRLDGGVHTVHHRG